MTKESIPHPLAISTDWLRFWTDREAELQSKIRALSAELREVEANDRVLREFLSLALSRIYELSQTLTRTQDTIRRFMDIERAA